MVPLPHQPCALYPMATKPSAVSLSVPASAQPSPRLPLPTAWPQAPPPASVPRGPPNPCQQDAQPAGPVSTVSALQSASGVAGTNDHMAQSHRAPLSPGSQLRSPESTTKALVSVALPAVPARMAPALLGVPGSVSSLPSLLVDTWPLPLCVCVLSWPSLCLFFYRDTHHGVRACSVPYDLTLTGDLCNDLRPPKFTFGGSGEDPHVGELLWEGLDLPRNTRHWAEDAVIAAPPPSRGHPALSCPRLSRLLHQLGPHQACLVGLTFWGSVCLSPAPSTRHRPVRHLGAHSLASMTVADATFPSLVRSWLLLDGVASHCPACTWHLVRCSAGNQETLAGAPCSSDIPTLRW